MGDLDHLRAALEEAEIAGRNGEWPVGAVVVRDDAIVSRGRNETRMRNDPTAHAEFCAIREACKSLGSPKLDGCAIFTTIFPCPMCEMTIREAGIERVVYGARPYRWVREVKFRRPGFTMDGPLLEAPCRDLFENALREAGRTDILDYESGG